MKPRLPLVYACSGASSAAQMANHIAVKLDRLEVAEMSCIAGVGGDVKPLLKTALSGRPIIALDGCPLHCAAMILARHGLRADKHYDLGDLGVKKRKHEDFDSTEAACVLQKILHDPAFPGSDEPTAGTSPQARQAAAVSFPPAGADEGGIPESASPPCFLSDIENKNERRT